MGRLSILLVVAIALWMPCSAGALTWEPRADTIGELFGRGLHAGGAIDDRIYIAGGGHIGASLWASFRTGEVYDPVSDSWALIADMAQFRAAPASAVASFQGEPRLYVIGGLDINDFLFIIPHTDIEEYDPLTDTWRTRGATLPDFSVWGSCAVTVDNLVYIMGGADDVFSGLTPRVVAYDPESDTLTPRASMPMGVSDGACATVGRHIYWFGGWESSQGWGNLPVRKTFVYDVDADSWSDAATPSPTPRANAAAIAVGSLIHLVGGWNGSGQYSGMYNTTDTYDTTTDTWIADDPEPLGCVEDDGSSARGRTGFTLHRVNDGTEDVIFAVGGNIGISIPTRCNEGSGGGTAPDTEPPSFAGLAAATEVTCFPDQPEVLLTWQEGADSQSPPVLYNVYRGTTPDFTPSDTNRLVQRHPDLSYTDALDPADCFQSFWYIVRAEDSAVPPNEDMNTVRVQVDLTCEAPPLPSDIANNLLAAKDAALRPALDWSSYTPSAGVVRYRVRRTINKLGLPGNIVDEPDVQTWVDTNATGDAYFYDLRAVNACDAESLN